MTNLALFALLLLSAILCMTATQAFVPLLNPQRKRLGSPCRTSAWPVSADARTGRKGRPRRTAAREASSGTGLNMLFGRRRQEPQQLTEEELVAMEKSRQEANRKVEEFIERRKAEKEERRAAQKAEQRQKVADRIKADREEAEHKKVYIPQRLEEIEKEEAKLQDKMSAFNTKIKDKEIQEL